MADNRIDLYIHEQAGIANTGAISSENGTTARVFQSQTVTQAAAQNTAATKGMVVASTIASGAFNYVTSNVGKYTGSQMAQQNVNNAMTLVQTGAMFFINPALAISNIGLQIATTAIDEAFRKSQESVGLSQARARAGYTANAASYRRR